METEAIIYFYSHYHHHHHLDYAYIVLNTIK